VEWRLGWRKKGKGKIEIRCGSRLDTERYIIKIEPTIIDGFYRTRAMREVMHDTSRSVLKMNMYSRLQKV